MLSVYPSNYHNADSDAFYYHNIITLIMKLIRYDALSRKLHTQESEGTKSSERAENVEVVILMMIVIILIDDGDYLDEDCGYFDDDRDYFDEDCDYFDDDRDYFDEGTSKRAENVEVIIMRPHRS